MFNLKTFKAGLRFNLALVLSAGCLLSKEAKAQLLCSGAEQISVGVNQSPPEGESLEPVIPPLGELIVFSSKALNLTSGDKGDSSNTPNIYLYSPTQGIELISINTQGLPPQKNDGASLIFGALAPAISKVTSDGSYAVTFNSDAKDISDPFSDSNTEGVFTQVFLRSSKLKKTALISKIPDSAEDTAGNESSDQTTVALIGENPTRYRVCFRSAASNLVANQAANGGTTIYCRNLSLSDTAISLEPMIIIKAGELDGNLARPSLSADGLILAFESDATIIGDKPRNGFKQIYTYAFNSESFSLISSNASGQQAVGNSTAPSITGNASTLVFSYDGQGGDSVPDLKGFERITKSVVVRHDVATSVNKQVNTNSLGAPSDSFALSGRIDSVGKYAVFSDLGSNLTSGETFSKRQVYVKDLETEEVIRTSITVSNQAGDDDSGFNSNQSFAPPVAIGRRDDAAASPFVAYISFAPNLASKGVPSSTNPFIFRSLLAVATPTPTPTPTATPTSTVTPTATPRTFKANIKITEPPTIELLVKRPDGSFDIQVICELFKLGSKVFQNAEELAELLASKKARLSYSLEIQRAGSKKRLTRVSSRNTVTVRRLTPGSYTVRYKVIATQGSKKIESRFSPRARVRG